MRLTVGSLPPAVYWRRRAIVAGAALLLVLFLFYSCGGDPTSNAAGPNSSSAARTKLQVPTTGTPSASPSASAAASTSTSASPTVSATEQVAQPHPSAPLCADADIAVTVSVDPTSIKAGTLTKIQLTIKNISTHACNRDVGADPQELRVMSGTTIVWSSDYCQTVHGVPDVRYFEPNVQTEFYQYWDGFAMAPGCKKGAAATAGSYQVVGRLDAKLSSPAPLTVTA